MAFNSPPPLTDCHCLRDLITRNRACQDNVHGFKKVLLTIRNMYGVKTRRFLAAVLFGLADRIAREVREEPTGEPTGIVTRADGQFCIGGAPVSGINRFKFGL